MEYLTVMLGRVLPLGVEVDAVVVRVPSHVIPVRKGCHRQWRRHRHARSLVSDTEYLLHRLLALRLDKLPRLDKEIGIMSARSTQRTRWRRWRMQISLFAPFFNS